MEKREILEILIDWNFWKKDQYPGIRRDQLLKTIERKADANEIMVVSGARRTGKSTIIIQYLNEKIKKGTKKEDILIINFEDPRFQNLDIELLNRIYDIYETEIKSDSKEQYVVLDEVQVIDGWEKFARYLHENRRAKVFVTGSSSNLLSSEYSTVLTGRHIDTEVFPLSFREYLEFKGIRIKKTLDLVSERHNIKKELKEYINTGGFPKVTMEKDPKNKKDILGTYFRDILVKDIIFRYNIRDIKKIEELSKYYLTNISSPNSYNKIKNILNTSLDTIERYSEYLESTYMLFFIKKYSYSLKDQILNPRKVYCIDTGIRNTVSFAFSEDYGRLIENIVFMHLRRKYTDIYYWKDAMQKEVDFLVKEKNRITRSIQVCWNIDNDKTRKREISGLLSSMNTFNLKDGLILTENTEEEIIVEGKKITIKPVWKWLLE